MEAYREHLAQTAKPNVTAEHTNEIRKFTCAAYRATGVNRRTDARPGCLHAPGAFYEFYGFGTSGAHLTSLHQVRSCMTVEADEPMTRGADESTQLLGWARAGWRSRHTRHHCQEECT